MSMRRIAAGGASVAIACSVLVLSGPRAWAQSDPSFCEPAIIGGTNGYRTARLLGSTNARAFATPRFAERMLFPKLGTERDGDDIAIVSAYEGNFLFGAAQVPSVELGADCPAEYKYAMREVDTGAFNLGLAVGVGEFSFFYAGGLTASSAFAYEDAASRSRFPVEQTLVGLPMSVLAPLYNKREVQDGTTYLLLDYMAGVGWDSSFGSIRAGYVGSTGFYTNVSERQLRLFAAAVLQSKLDDLPYVVGGFDNIPSPAGYTSVFGRSLPLYAPPRYDALTAQPDGVSTTNVKLATAHLRQLDLVEWFDVHAAYAIAPSSLLHEGRVAVHTPDFHWIPGEEDDESAAVTGGALLSGGFVRLPDMYYYGVEGGAKKAFRIEVQGTVKSEETHMGLNLSVRYNEPEILATFPYAQDVWNLYFSLHVSAAGS